MQGVGYVEPYEVVSTVIYLSAKHMPGIGFF